MRSFNLQAALLSCDSHLTETVTPSLQKMDLNPIVCAELPAALECLNREKLDVVLVDRDADRSLQVLVAMRKSRSNQRSVGIAIAAGREGIRGVFEAADFVIEKPFPQSRLDQVLKVAYGRMLHARRKYYRRPADFPISISRAGQKFSAVSLNISDSGMAMQLKLPVACQETLDLEFSLPNVSSAVRGCAEVIWADEKGLCGVRFVSLDSHLQKKLTDWIAAEFQQEISERYQLAFSSSTKSQGARQANMH